MHTQLGVFDDRSIIFLTMWASLQSHSDWGFANLINIRSTFTRWSALNFRQEQNWAYDWPLQILLNEYWCRLRIVWRYYVLGKKSPEVSDLIVVLGGKKTELGFSYRTCLEPDFGSKNRVSLHLLFSVVHFMVLFKGMSPGPESLESVNLNTVT